MMSHANVTRLTSFMVGLGLVVLGAAVVLGDERDIICRPGYARSVRPPESVTERLKRDLCREQQPDNRGCMRENELDAIVPACLGGLHERGNVQLQPWALAHIKDLYEAQTCRAYCNGEIELPEARARFHRD